MYIFDDRHEKHQKRRDELNQRYIGELSADPADASVEKPSHGIPRPSWFRPITTESDVRAAAVAMHQRR